MAAHRDPGRPFTSQGKGEAMFDKAAEGLFTSDSHYYHAGIINFANNFTPLTFPQVAEIMSKKTYKPLDHHGRH